MEAVGRHNPRQGCGDRGGARLVIRACTNHAIGESHRAGVTPGHVLAKTWRRDGLVVDAGGAVDTTHRAQGAMKLMLLVDLTLGDTVMAGAIEIHTAGGGDGRYLKTATGAGQLFDQLNADLAHHAGLSAHLG